MSFSSESHKKIGYQTQQGLPSPKHAHALHEAEAHHHHQNPGNQYSNFSQSKQPSACYLSGNISVSIDALLVNPQDTYATNNFTTNEVVPAKEGEDADYVWVSTTPQEAHHLTGRALVSSSSIRGDLWVIRAEYNGDVIPGKLFVREKMASITYAGNVINLYIEKIEVLCAKPHKVKWVGSSDGNIPVGAIRGGITRNGEVLYIGRAKFVLLKFLTPGKVHPSHKCCYIVRAGRETAVKHYEVLTKA